MHRDDLFLEFVRVVERAAMAAARTMGQGDRKYSDQVAVESMRKEMESVDIDGTIVIGEGERDEAPMLYIGEKVGRGGFPVDIAVDPLEGTNLCATGTPNAIAVIAAAEKGGLLNAPDIYMEKLVVGPSSKGKVDINAPVEDNLKALAKALDREVHDLVIIVLDRPRHERLIADIRKAGARIRLISDGDLSAGISAAVVGTGVHAVMGTGGAPEGVLTAAAMRCLNGEIQGKLVLTKPADKERLKKMGITNLDKVYRTEELAPGPSVIFAAAGVTDGALLKGVRFFGDGLRTHTLVMTTVPHQVRFIDTIHAKDDPDVKIRF
ncbi:MAG TPA: class II fructose-bisphosphatase [Vicinamibacteria bacterium]|nr:class II fructose-bisphosphatase [Vicinamibacteria bacterium]